MPQKLPLVLSGPIVRQVNERSASVWVALREDVPVRLEVLEAREDGSPGAVVATGEAAPLTLGPRLHLVMVTAHGPLLADREYLYALHFGLPSGAVGLADDGVLDFGDPDPIRRLAYAGRALPGLRRMSVARERLHIAHGSCRKPHGEGLDALALLDGELDRALGQRLTPPVQALFLTGDQIYADDVHPLLLEAIHRLTALLIGPDRERSVDLAAFAEALKPGHRGPFMRREAGFTSTAADSHLVSFHEFVGMYLFVWSDLPWRLTELVADEALRPFLDALPAVRRALANVPVWMLFDDHDVTDDWNRSGLWVDHISERPVGRRVIRNGLAAYALFQHWGNTPEAFADGTPGGALLAALKASDGSEGGRDVLDGLLAVPGAQGAQTSSARMSWSWSIQTPSFQVLAPDTRTRRGFPSLMNPPALLGEAALAELLAAGGARDFTILIAPTPVLGVALFEQIQDLAVLAAHKLGIKLSKGQLDDLIDCESWMGHRPTWKALVRGLEAWGQVLVLSGDVHFGFAATLVGDEGRIVNFTSSSLRNRSFPGAVMKLLNIGARPLQGGPLAGPGPSPSEVPAPLEAPIGPVRRSIDDRTFVEELLPAEPGPDAAPLSGPASEAHPHRGDVLGEPNIGLLRFPPGKVEQRLLYRDKADKPRQELRHVATLESKPSKEAPVPEDIETLNPTVVRVPGGPLQGASFSLSGVPSHVTGVAVKVTSIVVKDTQPGFLGTDVADVYPIFLVIYGPSADPVAFQHLNVFNDIRPGSALPISPVAPPTIARSLSSVPKAVDVHVLLMRSRQRTRDVSAGIEQARTSSEGAALISSISAALAATNPAAAPLVAAGSQLLGLVCRSLSQAKDRQLFYGVASVEASDGLGIGAPIVLEDRGARVVLEIRGLTG